MDKLSLSLECPICFQSLQDPRILPCAHTFCIKCIHSLCEGTRTTKCPVCRVVAPVPASGGRGFPVNFLVANLLEQIQGATKQEVTRTQCKGKHAPMEVALYCTTCSVLICHKCAYDSHPKRRHKCVPIEDAVESIHNQLAQISDTLDKRAVELDSAQIKLENHEANFLQECSTINEEINDFYDRVVASLERKRSAILRTVDTIVQQYQQKLEDKFDEIRAIQQDVEEREEFVESVQGLPPVELITRMENQQILQKSLEIPTIDLTAPSLRCEFKHNLVEDVAKFCSLHYNKAEDGEMDIEEMDEGGRGNTSINIIIRNNYKDNRRHADEEEGGDLLDNFLFGNEEDEQEADDENDPFVEAKTVNEEEEDGADAYSIQAAYDDGDLLARYADENDGFDDNLLPSHDEEHENECQNENQDSSDDHVYVDADDLEFENDEESDDDLSREPARINMLPSPAHVLGEDEQEDNGRVSLTSNKNLPEEDNEIDEIDEPLRPRQSYFSVGNSYRLPGTLIHRKPAQRGLINKLLHK